MLKRTIIIATPTKVSLRDNQLVCTSLDNPAEIKYAPVEDLGLVMIENQRAALTVPLINALADNNVPLVYCDSHHMPASILYSLSANSTQSEMMRLQMSATEASNNRVWKQLIESKIKNQSFLLDKLGKNGSLLKPLYSNIKSGDSGNREGAAARIYWKQLFGRDFIRDREESSPNNLLNYGYSILRSAVVRSLLGSGLNPALGVFHRNRYNPMPLADDVMEPFRPFVDEIVYWLFMNGETELTTDNKRALIGSLDCDTQYEKIRRPLQLGLSITTASIGQYYKGETKTISLPKLE